jgi:NAD(P)-dependent dehydrogenase (short-subunit alcohol dehydrogenase family)
MFVSQATAVLFAKVWATVVPRNSLLTTQIQGGANVILIARRADALSKVAEQCVAAHKESGIQQGGIFASIQLDVSDKQQIASLWEMVPQDLQNVDILGTSQTIILLTCNFLILCS